MFQKNNYLSGTTSERKNKTYNNIPQIIKSRTARASVILLDTSDISQSTFNYDSKTYSGRTTFWKKYCASSYIG